MFGDTHLTELIVGRAEPLWRIQSHPPSVPSITTIPCTGHCYCRTPEKQPDHKQCCNCGNKRKQEAAICSDEHGH